MTLTGAGYVPLGQAAQTAGKAAGQVAKFNPNHDERGRFAAADEARAGAAHGRQRPARVAQGGESEEENRGAEESADPLAEARGQQWAKAIETLRALDPKNPNLSYVTAPDWVPSDQNIADINAEIAKVAVKRITDNVMPDGNMIGTPGGSNDVRNLPGGAKAAQAAFDYLKVGGTPYRGEYPGEMVVLPGDVGYVGYRNNSVGIPTLDVRVPDAHIKVRFHYLR
jgi:hypothetical protein